MHLELDYPWSKEKSERPFAPQSYLNLTAGPCTVSPRVLNALGQPIIYQVSQEYRQMAENVVDMLKYIFQTQNQFTFVQQTACHGGNETVLYNLTEPGDTILIAVGGVWGERIFEMAKRCRLNVIRLEVEVGEVLTPNAIEVGIEEHRPSLLYLIHGETSTGTLQPLDGIADICHKYDCLLAIDAVVSVAAVPLFVDRWKIDAAVGGSQKAVGAPPGLSLLTFSDKARERILTKKTLPPFFFDAVCLAKSWSRMDDKQLFYHYTSNGNMLAALHEALSTICEEGLESCWDRHRKCNEMFWEGCKSLGLQTLVPKQENRFCGVTAVQLPTDVNAMKLLQHLSKTYKVQISFGIGPSGGNNIRVGFMGYNARSEVVHYFLRIFKDTIAFLRSNVTKHDLRNCHTNGNMNPTVLFKASAR